MLTKAECREVQFAIAGYVADDFLNPPQVEYYLPVRTKQMLLIGSPMGVLFKIYPAARTCRENSRYAP